MRGIPQHRHVYGKHRHVYGICLHRYYIGSMVLRDILSLPDSMVSLWSSMNYNSYSASSRDTSHTLSSLHLQTNAGIHKSWNWYNIIIWYIDERCFPALSRYDRGTWRKMYQCYVVWNGLEGRVAIEMGRKYLEPYPHPSWNIKQPTYTQLPRDLSPILCALPQGYSSSGMMCC